VGLQAGEDIGVVRSAGAAFGDEDGGGQAEFGGGGEAGGGSDVGDDDGDLDAGEGSQADGLGDGEEVGASAGEEDSEPEGRKAFGPWFGKIRDGRILIGSCQKAMPQGPKAALILPKVRHD
jgi:hypothetical protein